MPTSRRKPGAGLPGILPGYDWNKRISRYRNLSTGRFVSKQAVNGLLTNVANGSGATLSKLAQQAVRGGLTPRQFYELSRREVKHAYNACAALGKGGWHQMTAADWGRNGNLLRAEYARLRDFSQAIANGKLTEAQAAARASLYADSAYKRYWELDREGQRVAGMTRACWVTVGDEKVCLACLELEGLGFVPIEQLPNPGGEVHAGCRCELDYATG